MAPLSTQPASRLSSTATYDVTAATPPSQAGVIYLLASAYDLLQQCPNGDLLHEHFLVMGAEISNTVAATTLTGRGVKISANAWGMRVRRARADFARLSGLLETALKNAILASTEGVSRRLSGR